MGAYLEVKALLQIDDENPNLVKEFHTIYTKHGLVPQDFNYKESTDTNQQCFLDRDDTNSQRLYWASDWCPFIVTYPSIRQGEGVNPVIDKKYTMIRQEVLLFPEDEITEEGFLKILQIVTDLYNLNSIYSVIIEKEY